MKRAEKAFREIRLKTKVSKMATLGKQIKVTFEIDGQSKDELYDRVLVSDAGKPFRILSRGGVFLYPADSKDLPGRLRLMYEGSPMAFLVEEAGGAAQGVQLAINVAAMLMAFVALVALLNFGLQWFGTSVLRLSGEPLSLQFLLGQLLRPLTWVMGVPWQDTAYVGGLIGLKTTLNEFVAYLDLAKLPPDVAAKFVESAAKGPLALERFVTHSGNINFNRTL